MYSHYPSPYSVSPHDSYYIRPDHLGQAIQRRRQLEAARQEQALREAARISEWHRAQQRQQEEADARENYFQQLRRQRRSMYYNQPVMDDMRDDGVQGQFFPFNFTPQRRRQSIPTRTPRYEEPQRQRPHSDISVSFPIVDERDTSAMKTHPTAAGSRPHLPAPAQMRPHQPEPPVHQDNERRASAASTIQQVWRTYAARKHALIQLAAINASRSLQSTFTFPTSVDFVQSSPEPSSASDAPPAFAYTANNRPIFAFEDSATRLLTRLDAVDSGGDGKVRVVRREIVGSIESALKALENRKLDVWKAYRGNMPDVEVEGMGEHTGATLELEREDAAVEAALSESEDAVLVDINVDVDDEDWVDAWDGTAEDEKDAQMIETQLNQSAPETGAEPMATELLVEHANFSSFGFQPLAN